MTEEAKPSESQESKTPGALTRWPRDLTDLWAGWAPFGASIEQPDHRNGDQDHQQLPGVDGENINWGLRHFARCVVRIALKCPTACRRTWTHSASLPWTPPHLQDDAKSKVRNAKLISRFR